MHVLEDWYPVKPTAFILLMTELPGHHEELKDKIAKKKQTKLSLLELCIFLIQSEYVVSLISQSN